MDEYRMLNDIHKQSSTRVEFSSSSSEWDDEETDKSRFSEKEIEDQTGCPKLPVPPNLHKDHTKTVEPEQCWIRVHEGPLTTESEQSDKSVLSDILSAVFKGYKHVWDYRDNTRLSESPLQEYGILPHSRTYYCLLFSLYHMFIIFVISY